jgi:hypothetical protein
MLMHLDQKGKRVINRFISSVNAVNIPVGRKAEPKLLTLSLLENSVSLMRSLRNRLTPVPFSSPRVIGG